MMKKSNKKGFTLVELIVVIAIMAILAAVLVPTVTNKINDAKRSAAESDIQSAAKAISLKLAESEEVLTRATIKAIPEVTKITATTSGYHANIKFYYRADGATSDTVIADESTLDDTAKKYDITVELVLAKNGTAETGNNAFSVKVNVGKLSA